MKKSTILLLGISLAFLGLAIYNESVTVVAKKIIETPAPIPEPVVVKVPEFIEPTPIVS